MLDGSILSVWSQSCLLYHLGKELVFVWDIGDELLRSGPRH